MPVGTAPCGGSASDRRRRKAGRAGGGGGGQDGGVGPQAGGGGGAGAPAAAGGRRRALAQQAGHGGEVRCRRRLRRWRRRWRGSSGGVQVGDGAARCGWRGGTASAVGGRRRALLCSACGRNSRWRRRASRRRWRRRRWRWRCDAWQGQWRRRGRAHGHAGAGVAWSHGRRHVVEGAEVFARARACVCACVFGKHRSHEERADTDGACTVQVRWRGARGEG